jgi:hypothetical protein
MIESFLSAIGFTEEVKKSCHQPRGFYHKNLSKYAKRRMLVTKPPASRRSVIEDAVGMEAVRYAMERNEQAEYADVSIYY